MATFPLRASTRRPRGAGPLALVAFVLLGLGPALGVNPTSAQAGSVAIGPGCDNSRPAIAHRANGIIVNRQPASAPVPCGMSTGHPSAESRIGVTSNGTIIFSPVALDVAGINAGIPLGPGNIGIARSSNNGLTWAGVLPEGPAGLPWPNGELADDQLYIDHQTSRIFYSNPSLGNGNTAVHHSADSGAHWAYSTVCCTETENPWITFAKPRTSQTVGYPNIVYYCGNVGTLIAVEGALCHKSLDGGSTWITLGQGFTWHKYVPVHSECGSDIDVAGYPSPASDGSLYLIYTCGGKTYLARSTDEAATWPTVRELPFRGPTSSPGDNAGAGIGGFFFLSLRMDAQNNMYVAYSDTHAGISTLQYKTSSNLGKSWSPAINVLAPGVTTIDHWYLAVSAPGQLAFSYLGHRAKATAFDGYITSTKNPLSPNPVFWSAAVNPPGKPLTFGPSGLQYDFIGTDIGPDGTPWASFYANCGTTQPTDTFNPACINPPKEGLITSYGFAGRLAFAAPAQRVVSKVPSRHPVSSPPGLPATGLEAGLVLFGLSLLAVAVGIRRHCSG